MRKLLVVAGVVAFSLPAIAQDTPTRVTPDALTWKENPAFPKGVQIATLVGDPTKAGEVVVLRIKFPPNFQMPPHTHPYSEVVTIISGDIGTSHGEKFEKKGELLKPGSLWVYPAKHAHYAWTGNEEGILQVQFVGPGASITSTQRMIRGSSNHSPLRGRLSLAASSSDHEQGNN